MDQSLFKKNDFTLHLLWKLMSSRRITWGEELLSNSFSLCQGGRAEFGHAAIFIHNSRGPEEKRIFYLSSSILNAKLNIITEYPKQIPASW